MCTREQWERCNASEAYHAAKKFALELEQHAKKLGYNDKGIRIRNKEQVIKGGFGKADAQVIWEDGPKEWALELSPEDRRAVSTVAETDSTVSFYLL